jgi:hypothetical protein
MTAERMKDSGKLIEVVRRITAAGRSALED